MSAPAVELEHRGGVPWLAAPEPHRFHKHRWQTRADYYGDFAVVERCACGAIRRNYGRWVVLDKPRTRWMPKVFA